MSAEVVSENRVKVFIPDDNFIWLTANIIHEIKVGQYEVEISDPEYKSRSTNTILRTIAVKNATETSVALPLQNDNIPDIGVNDMCSLNYLHEASILDNLRRRFKNFLPYTYTGDICIATNPYQWLKVYTHDIGDSYVSRLRHEIAPHVYATSAAAYRGLRDFNQNQSILVSGESGAGKTETVKILMGHLAHISGRKNDGIIERVLQANPLLESFGNAKTTRNDNSSRFGKFTQLQFDSASLLAGGLCVTYLLEKSRVVTQNENERNYHIFHQIFAAPNDMAEKLHLQDYTCADFNYTNRGDIDTNVIEGVEDGVRLTQTLQALELVGVNNTSQQLILNILAGILYLGQISYTGGTDDSKVDDRVEQEVLLCCELLGIQETLFREKTTTRIIEVAGEDMIVPLSKNQATDGRDALAKEIYARLFSWLVSVINTSTSSKESNSNNNNKNTAAINSLYELDDHKSNNNNNSNNNKNNRIIALLDIFGFESFQINRFEQLCINYANERLQQKFTEDVFRTVQEEYKAEGLEWELIGYKDNADVLELMELKTGIIPMLNEECMLPKGNDAQFLSKLAFANKDHPRFNQDVHMSKDAFCILHYAGAVTYTVTSFLERNKDTLPAETRSLMLSSSNDILRHVFGTNNYEADTSSNKQGGVRGSGCTSGTSGGSRSVTGSPVRSRPRTRSFIGGDNLNNSKSSSGSSGGGSNTTKRQSFMKAETVTTKFKSQLDKLMIEIAVTHVQYVRCIKPNALKSSSVFDRSMVVEQLRCAGMIEAIRISRAAYPYRLLHKEFIDRFGKLRPKLMKIQRGGADSQCAALLKDVWPNPLVQVPVAVPAAGGKKGASSNNKPTPAVPAPVATFTKAYEIGKTRVYFSSGVLEMLESMRGKLIASHVITIQKTYRGYHQRHLYTIIRKHIILLQSMFRKHLQVTKYRKFRQATISLQSYTRRHQAMKVLQKLKYQNAVTRIQKWGRMQPCRKQFLKMRYASILVGARMKMCVQRQRYCKRLLAIKEGTQLTYQLEALKHKMEEERLERERKEADNIARVLAEKQAYEAEIRAEQERQRIELEIRLAEEAALAAKLQAEKDAYELRIKQEVELQKIEREKQFLQESELLKQQKEMIEAEAMRLKQLNLDLENSMKLQLESASAHQQEILLQKDRDIQKEAQKYQQMEAEKMAQMAAQSLSREMNLITETSGLKSIIEEKEQEIIQLMKSHDEIIQGMKKELEKSHAEINTLKTQIIKEKQAKEKEIAAAVSQAEENKLQYEKDVSLRSEELSLLEKLQTEVILLRQSNQLHQDEIREYKQQLRVLNDTDDKNISNIVYQKVSLENTRQEMQLLKLEKEKNESVMKLWKAEKQHMMDALLLATNEADEALRDKEDTEKKYQHEHQMNELRHDLTQTYLNKYFVHDSIIKGLNEHIQSSATANMKNPYVLSPPVINTSINDSKISRISGNSSNSNHNNGQTTNHTKSLTSLSSFRSSGNKSPHRVSGTRLRNVSSCSKVKRKEQKLQQLDISNHSNNGNANNSNHMGNHMDSNTITNGSSNNTNNMNNTTHNSMSGSSSMPPTHTPTATATQQRRTRSLTNAERHIHGLTADEAAAFTHASRLALAGSQQSTNTYNSAKKTDNNHNNNNNNNNTSNNSNDNDTSKDTSTSLSHDKVAQDSSSPSSVKISASKERMSEEFLTARSSTLSTDNSDRSAFQQTEIRNSTEGCTVQ